MQDAIDRVQSTGLSVRVVGVNVNAEAGTVVRQVPDGGAPHVIGGIVEIDVASGQVPVPDVVGRPRDEATRAILDAGFRIPSLRERKDDRIPIGAVSDLNPKPGRIVPRGTDVEVTISSGR